MKRKSPHILYNTLFFIVACFTFHNAKAQTITYNYDALGRVTYVNDSVNGNRDYDYDAAGNRKQVDIGTSSDAANDPTAPLTPTSLSYSGPVSLGNIYEAKWKVAATATYYIFLSVSDNPTVDGPTKSFTIDSTNVYGISPAGSTFTTPNAIITVRRPGKPVSVKACSPIGCSAVANF